MIKKHGIRKVCKRGEILLKRDIPDEKQEIIHIDLVQLFKIPFVKFKIKNPKFREAIFWYLCVDDVIVRFTSFMCI